MKTTKPFLVFLFFLLSFSTFSQISDDLWSKTTVLAKQTSKKIKRDTLPNNFKIYHLNLNLLKSKLSGTVQNKGDVEKHRTILTFPNANGVLEEFYIFEAPIMERSLREKYPTIQSYIGKGVSNPNSIIRFSITTIGLNAIILQDSDDAVYINRYTSDQDFYIVYSKKSLPKQELFDCGTDDIDYNFKQSKSNINEKTQNANDGILRIYKLAIVATGEYSQWQLTRNGISSDAQDQYKKEVVLSSIVATMTIVNAVFERDVSLRMQLVSNNADIIFLNPNTDNLTNSDKYLMLTEGQSIIENFIGTDNYDIGHVFAQANLGGVAYTRSVCNNSVGVSSSYNPVGAYFEGVIMHEIGHQFGASHTYNSCSNPSNYPTAVEPGSGSTIMSYAGVCSAMFGGINRDIQMNTDFYFHFVNIQEMWGFISSSNTQCADLTSSGNSPPILNELTNYTLPVSTPFLLNAIASDSDGDNLTFTWEQLDASEPNWPLTSTSTEGPAFRSMPPNILSHRSFPNESTVLMGELSNFSEVLPSVTRTMKFGVTVRDNNINGGQTASEEALLSFDSNSGPFKVTSQSTSTTWEVGSNQTIIWDVANTDAPPVNCSQVNILLSLDGGLTYPIILANKIPNNGSHEIIVPDVSTAGARIKVESVNNVFYAVNNDYLFINPPIGLTFVPDKNFEQELIDLGYDDVLDSYVLKNNISNIKSLNVSDKNIYNLKGIEDFTELETLVLDRNKLISLDVSNNLNLKTIRLQENRITSLDFSANLKLEIVNAYKNYIDVVNVSKNSELSTLSLPDNKLIDIDVSNNPKLLHLSVSNNKLIDIDVSNNPKLLYLYVDSNDQTNYNLLTSLDVSKNLELKHLVAHNNKITALDITKNLYLEYLDIGKNKLESLDISKNLLLKKLDINYNHLSNIDISKNTNLDFIEIGNNEIESIDFTKNINLEQIFLDTYFILPEYANSKLLTSLDITKNIKLRDLSLKNHNLTSLDVSKNENLNYLNALNNNISCIQVNGGQLLYTSESWLKDENTNYSMDCLNGNNDDDNDLVKNDVDICPNTPIGEVVDINGCAASQNTYYVPDPNFEQELINLGIDEDGVINKYFLTNNLLQVKTLNLSEKGIVDLTGIENFVGLNTLNCQENNLTNLDVSKNINLISLNCSGNQLNVLDVGQNTKLQYLYCSNNQLSGLDVTQQIELVDLRCSDNQLTTLDVSKNINLNSFICYNNHLTGLDVSQQTELRFLYCSNNQLTGLDVSQQTKLVDLWCSDNQLTALDVSKNIKLISLHCSGNQLSVLDISKNVNLEGLSCEDNKLISLDVSQNPSLQSLYCSNNQLTALDVSKNVNLISLGCSGNQLTTLDVTQNPSLQYLYCSNNQLTALDVSKNVNLEGLSCEDNKLTILDISDNYKITSLSCSYNELTRLNVKNNNNLNFHYFSAYGNPNLNCIEVDNSSWSTTNWINKDSQSVFRESCQDDDGDGILNNQDLCPDTPVGELVDANGCILLGYNNFTIQSVGETCPDKDNGQLTISADQNYTYSVTVNGASYTMNNTSDLLIDGLSPGSYEVCIEVASLTSPYCYSLNIEEGASVSGKADSDKNKTSVEMLSGTAPFEIFINGRSQFSTYSSSFDIATSHGDIIEVKTAVNCEGVYQKEVQVFDDITLYPNPTSGLLNIAIPHKVDKVSIEIFNLNRQLILKSEYPVIHGKVELDITDYPVGVYYVKVSVDKSTTLRVLKI